MHTTERLDSCNCFAARKAARLITSLYERHLAPSSLTSPQFAVLAHLDEVGQASIRDLVSALATERSSIVRALQPLERSGLVKLSADADDSRRNMVRLTQDGQARLLAAVPLWQAAQAEFERTIGSALAQQIRASVSSLGA